jgi:hypothetical protein
VQLRDVDRIDRVDAALDERAFAPAEHLLAEAHRALLVVDRELGPDERIEEAELLADLILGQIRQLVVAGVFEIVEVAGAEEAAEVLAVIERKLGRGLDRVAEQVAVIVVQIAVVVVCGERALRRALNGIRREADKRVVVRLRDQRRILVLDANADAVRQRRVDIAVPAVLLAESDRVGLAGETADQRECERNGQRMAGEDGRRCRDLSCCACSCRFPWAD